MPTFLDLSNELLYRIIKAVPGDDLQSLSLTNKLLHALSDKDCKRHLTLKRYSTLCFRGDYTFGYVHPPPKPKSHEDTKDAFLFLESIIKDPGVKDYPQTMLLGNCDDEGDTTFQDHDPTYWSNVDKRQSIITECSAQLKTMIEDCSFLPEDGKQKASIDILNPKYEGLAISLIATLLPNLRSIVTQGWLWGAASWRFSTMVGKIAEANQDPQSPNHNKALSQLEEFSMAHTDTEGGENISIYCSFAMLPSMRILRGTAIDGEIGIAWPLRFQPGSSNVTEINFTRSAVDGRTFESLLSGISALRKFIYHHYGSPVGFGLYSATRYVNSLRSHAASSLQLLDISAEDTSDFTDEELEEQQVGSLRIFRSLNYVRLEYTAFRTAGPDDGLNSEALEGQGFHSEEEEDEETAESMERLVDILPASIKSLTLINNGETEEIQELFRGMVEEMSEKLPVLKAVTFEGDDPLEDGTETALKHAGLTLWLKERTYGDCYTL